MLSRACPAGGVKGKIPAGTIDSEILLFVILIGRDVLADSQCLSLLLLTATVYTAYRDFYEDGRRHAMEGAGRCYMADPARGPLHLHVFKDVYMSHMERTCVLLTGEIVQWQWTRNKENAPDILSRLVLAMDRPAEVASALIPLIRGRRLARDAVNDCKAVNDCAS